MWAPEAKRDTRRCVDPNGVSCGALGGTEAKPLGGFVAGSHSRGEHDAPGEPGRNICAPGFRKLRLGR